VGSRSACDKVIREVKKHFSDYTKGYQDAYVKLAPKEQQAIANAIRLQKENHKTGSSNPGTQVHALVDYLRSLKGTTPFTPV